MKQRELEMILQKVEGHPRPKAALEQYQTPATIAAHTLYFAHGKGDLKDRIVLDAGCGTGILGIGAKLLGASEVIALDLDEEALGVAMKNARALRVDLSLLTVDIRDFPETVDTVLQNPPFGAQKRHADEPFLEHALKVGRVVYSFHNGETEDWVLSKVAAHGGTVTDRLRYSFPLPRTFEFHRKEQVDVPVTMFRIESKQRVAPAA